MAQPQHTPSFVHLEDALSVLFCLIDDAYAALKLVDSTLLEVIHPRQVAQGSGFAGAAWVRWGTFSVYGVKLHLICATNRVPISYELTPANVADISLTEELINEATLGEGVARRLLADTWPTAASS